MKPPMLSISVVCFLVTQRADPKFAVVPGKSIGSTFLGDDYEKVAARMKKPNFGDAAMGRSWTTWIGKGGRLDIFAVRGRGDKPTVRLIRVSSPTFRLPDGVHVGSPLQDVLKAWPTLRRIHFMHGHSIWDDAKDGLVVEGLLNKCFAIAVHPAGQWADQSYTPYLSGVSGVFK